MAVEPLVVSAESQDKHQVRHYVTDMNCGTKKETIFTVFRLVFNQSRFIICNDGLKNEEPKPTSCCWVFHQWRRIQHFRCSFLSFLRNTIYYLKLIWFQNLFFFPYIIHRIQSGGTALLLLTQHTHTEHACAKWTPAPVPQVDIRATAGNL